MLSFVLLLALAKSSLCRYDRFLTEKLRIKPELVAEFPVAHKTDVHSVLMNDVGNVSS